MPKLIDQYEVILLDLMYTIMFDGDRFGEDEDYGATYRADGGNRLTDDELRGLVDNTLQEMVARYRDPARANTFPELSVILRDANPDADLPRSEWAHLEVLMSVHECGVVPEEIAAVLNDLAKTHRLGLVSNVRSDPQLFRHELGRVGVAELFESMAFSSDDGIMKPSPQIFERALEPFNVDRAKVLFVGDDPIRDIRGAQSVGLDTVLINRPRRQPRAHEGEPPEPDHKIDSLLELAALI